jgi:hypothetical protein
MEIHLKVKNLLVKRGLAEHSLEKVTSKEVPTVHRSEEKCAGDMC